MTNKTLLLLFCWLLLPHLIQGQNLLPAPKKIEHTKNTFSFSEKVCISHYNTNTSISESLILALQKEDISPEVVVNGKKNKSEIILERLKSQSELSEVLKKNKLDEYFPGNEGYILKISTQNIHLFALSEAGIFYGIQTLNQLINIYGAQKNIPCMVIYDKPDFAIRAWQDDISRGPIPTMDMLKKQIRIMSSFKLNYFTLYTEHVFKLDKHPSIAPNDGITKAELIELSEFAKKYFVTLIGNYQSFGHMEETLSNPNYEHLAENDHIISPALDESYNFLDDVYTEIVPLYNGEYFNINCDETFGLGEGKSAVMVDSMGIAGVYSYHINKLDSILKKYDKKILMWGDITTSYPEIIPQLPQDMTVMAWGYHAAESFDYAITPISRRNLNFWVAPGVNCWSNVFPNMKETEINVYNFIRDGYKLNALGVLNTSWDDDGLNFFNNNWHGFAWGAENSWNAPPNLPKADSEQERIARYEQFNTAFDIHFYGLKKKGMTDLMIRFSSLHQSTINKVLKNSRFFEPVFPMHYEYIRKGKKEENRSTLKLLDSLTIQFNALYLQSAKNKHSLDCFSFAIKQAQFTLKKNVFRIALSDYLNGNTNMSETELKSIKKELIEELKILKKQYRSLWNTENRDYWLAENETKFDKLIQSLNALDGYTLIKPLNEVNEQGREIMIRSVFNDYPIHYEVNKDTVTITSPVYTRSFYISQNSTIKACSYDKTIPFPQQEITLIHHKGIGKLHNLVSEYSTYDPSYDGGGEYALVDGILGSKDDLRSRKWQGFSGQDIEIELYFPEKETLNSFSMGFFQNTESWVIFPRQVEIHIKNSIEENYQLYKIIKGEIAPEVKGNLKQQYKTSLNNIQPAYVKIIARYYGKLPQWHPAGSQYESMIFADEIIIE